MSGRNAKVLVAMSGGVDSSVAAALLQREGYEVVGCFMRLGSPGETLDELEAYDDARLIRDHENGRVSQKRIRIGHQGCCSINDAADARLVAARLDIPFYVCNFKKEFGRIIDYFVGEYNEGRTPNPCVRCNDWLKFGKLHTYARQIDADFVASGHYARIEPAPRVPSFSRANHTRDQSGRGVGQDPVRLLRAIDNDKDQSYVLFGSPRDRLQEMLLPIGGLKKRRVRELAREFDLPVFDKPDSQEICFVPDNDYASLIERRSLVAVQPGTIVDTSGKVVGEHSGHQHFTIGQRRGIGVALGYPIYVVHKDAGANTITVGEKRDLLAHACLADDANWLVDWSTKSGADSWSPCTAKIRYNARPVAARVRARADTTIEILFDEPQYAVAPGQAVVCYDGEVVMCGGWIAEVS